MHSSFEFTSSPSLPRNRQSLPPSGNDSFVPTSPSASHQLAPEIDGIRNYVSFFRDKPKTRPRIRVSYSSTPQMVLTPFSDFKPLQVPGAPQARAPEVKDDSGTDTDDDGHLIQKVKKDLVKRIESETNRKPQTKRRRVSSASSTVITIKTLIDERIIQPGPGVLSLDYRRHREIATITPEGRIEWNGLTFDSPSAFSIHVKRTVNPTRKADDGWKSIKYQGKYLDYYKLQLAKKRSEQNKVTHSSTINPDLQNSELYNKSTQL